MRGVCFIMIVLLQGAGALSVFAKDIFKDEAGRVLYTIDDDGIVSMFENSPTDLTISVNRGTRAEMQPQVTEVVPDSVTAGTNVVLRLNGRNLIGAVVKLSAPTIELGGYAGKPKSLDVPIRIPADVPPGPVVIEVTTPIGQAKTSIVIKDIKIGGSAPAAKDTSAKPGISTVAPTNCPEGMVGVAAERGGFCIEIDQTFATDYRKAEKSCAVTGKRLCLVAEWRTACEAATSGKLPLKNMIGEWEWTGTQMIKEVPGESTDYGGTGQLTSVLMGKSDCTAERDYQVWRTENISGRCCK
jgi:hypothetical protein